MAIDVDLPDGTPPGWYWLPSRPNERAWWDGSRWWRTEEEAAPWAELSSPQSSPAPPAISVDARPDGSSLGRLAFVLFLLAIFVFAAWGINSAMGGGSENITASEAADDLARSVGLDPRPIGSSGSTVEYCFAGSSTAISLTIRNPGGNTEQANGKANNQCLSMGRMASGSFVYASAQLEGSGRIECTIEVDGVVVERASSSGEYVIASCSGRVP